MPMILNPENGAKANQTTECLGHLAAGARANGVNEMAVGNWYCEMVAPQKRLFQPVSSRGWWPKPSRQHRPEQISKLRMASALGIPTRLPRFARIACTDLVKERGVLLLHTLGSVKVHGSRPGLPVSPAGLTGLRLIIIHSLKPHSASFSCQGLTSSVRANSLRLASPIRPAATHAAT